MQVREIGHRKNVLAEHRHLTDARQSRVRPDGAPIDLEVRATQLELDDRLHRLTTLKRTSVGSSSRRARVSAGMRSEPTAAQSRR